jgi:hypothetical protein
VLSHAAQWLYTGRYDELRDLLDFTTSQVSSVRLGYIAGEFFTDFAACTIAQPSNSRQPVAIRYRRHDGTVLSIRQAFDMHEITQEDFELASHHQDAMDAYVLRAYRIGNIEDCIRLLQDYVCPYELMAKTTAATIYERKIQWLRQTYPAECSQPPADEPLIEQLTDLTPTANTSSSDKSADTVQLAIADATTSQTDEAPAAAQPP